MKEYERFEITERIQDVFETQDDLLYIVTALYDRYKDLYGEEPIKNFKLQYEGVRFCHQCGAEINYHE